MYKDNKNDEKKQIKRLKNSVLRRSFPVLHTQYIHTPHAVRTDCATA